MTYLKFENPANQVIQKYGFWGTIMNGRNSYTQLYTRVPTVLRKREKVRNIEMPYFWSGKSGIQYFVSSILRHFYIRTQALRNVQKWQTTFGKFTSTEIQKCRFYLARLKKNRRNIGKLIICEIKCEKNKTKLKTFL